MQKLEYRQHFEKKLTMFRNIWAQTWPNIIVSESSLKYVQQYLDNYLHTRYRLS
jgi:hypothetical protein